MQTDYKSVLRRRFATRAASGTVTDATKRNPSITIFLSIFLLLFPFHSTADETLEADLLIVGGTESGCAAAVQAARMGVKKIILVNDIEWLGGQFSAEALGAIDENRAHNYDGTVPIPRSGIFRDVIDAIESKNSTLYGGVKRPGNTRVITTSRPVVSEEVFRELLLPFEKKGQLIRQSFFRVTSVITEANQVRGVEFVSTKSGERLTVRANLTIDASDWGDVIQGSGAAWDAGVDAKSEFNEPGAPAEAIPATDLNPITWCMILEERKEETLFPEPPGYDPRYFTGKWGWIDEDFAYSTRRLVDGKGYQEINHPDILLINNPSIDYPLDVYPANVRLALEASEPGASQKSIVAMTPAQRDIVFQDAKNHSLKYYYHLQQRFPKFRRMALSDEFGTEDKLPPKPYIRESLRLVAQHIITEQEVIGFESRSNYATTMFPDAMFSWQFEMDFHPTKRSWTTDKGVGGPWEADFRGARRFGKGGTGRCVFPLRSFVPEKVRGLLGAQKNLGYTSIVSSSCRLHDQSIHAGQACGAVAAVSLRNGVEPAELSKEPEHLAEIWTGLLEVESGAPLAIWPFSDLDPFDKDFAAIQQLALRRVLNLRASDTAFQPDQPFTDTWISGVLAAIEKAGYAAPTLNNPSTRREAAIQLWAALKTQPIPESLLKNPIAWQKDPLRDGSPGLSPPFGDGVRAFNFTSQKAPGVKGFTTCSGTKFDENSGFGFLRDLSGNIRIRKVDENPLKDSFVFTRDRDVWECEVGNGIWEVRLCFGDSDHAQTGQSVQIENESTSHEFDTDTGTYHEIQTRIEVKDGRLTLTLGKPDGGTNTCINWAILVPLKQE